MNHVRLARISIPLLLILIALPGCKKNDASVNPPTNGGGTSRTSVSPAQRKAAIDALTAVDTTLDWTALDGIVTQTDNLTLHISLAKDGPSH